MVKGRAVGNASAEKAEAPNPPSPGPPSSSVFGTLQTAGAFVATAVSFPPPPGRCESSCNNCPINLRSSRDRSEEHTSELQSRQYLVCRLLLEKKDSFKLSAGPRYTFEDPVQRSLLPAT